MINDINELIDTNLNLICETSKQEIFAHKFLNIKGREITGKFESEKFSDEMESRGLIRRINELCIVTEKGLEIYKYGGWKKFIVDKKNREIELESAKKEKDDIELRKSKVDLELAEKMLEEYPKTKWFARVSFIIAIVLMLKELYILIWR